MPRKNKASACVSIIWRRWKTLAASGLLTCGMSSTAHAINIDYGDMISQPLGTNLAVGYYDYTKSNEANLVGSGTLNRGTSLETNLGLARFIHYTSVLGIEIDPQIIVPFGFITNAKLGNERLNSTFGVSDPFAAMGIWLVNQPSKERYVVVIPYLWFPAGSYNRDQTNNLGGMRWKGAAQLGLVQGFGNKIWLQLTMDNTWYGDNSEAGDGHQVLSEEPTQEIEPWIWYDFTPTISAGLGYSQILGGKERLDGIANGLKTEESTVRFEYTQWITPTFQMQTSLSRDLHVVGGFKQDVAFQLRLCKVF